MSTRKWVDGKDKIKKINNDHTKTRHYTEEKQIKKMYRIPYGILELNAILAYV
jgi:hypothetical protein